MLSRPVIRRLPRLGVRALGTLNVAFAAWIMYRKAVSAVLEADDAGAGAGAKSVAPAPFTGERRADTGKWQSLEAHRLALRTLCAVQHSQDAHSQHHDRHSHPAVCTAAVSTGQRCAGSTNSMRSKEQGKVSVGA